MPVEIRELTIKGSVSGTSNIDKKFDERNSPLLSSEFVAQLKKDIVKEALNQMNRKINRKKLR